VFFCLQLRLEGATNAPVTMLNNKRGSLGHTKMSYRICNDAPNRTKINTGEKNPFFHKNLQ
jgi:hypothetical protein